MSRKGPNLLFAVCLACLPCSLLSGPAVSWALVLLAVVRGVASSVFSRACLLRACVCCCFVVFLLTSGGARWAGRLCRFRPAVVFALAVFVVLI